MAGEAANLLVLRLVVVARLVGDALLLRVLVHPAVPAALAGARLRAVDDVLRAEVGVRPRALVQEDVGAVGQRRGRPERPAAAAAPQRHPVRVCVHGGIEGWKSGGAHGRQWCVVWWEAQGMWKLCQGWPLCTVTVLPHCSDTSA